MIDVLGLGVSTIDEFVVLEHHPRLNEKQKILSRSRQCGGLTGSALVAASRMGCRCAHCITLGDGELSAFLRAAMAAEGVELIESGGLFAGGDAGIDDAGTGARADATAGAEPYFALILSEAGSGERSVLWDNSRARAPVIGARERELALAARCLFVDHIFASAILPLVAEARAAEVDVVGDFERTTPDSPALMDLANHIILPLAYARTAAGAGFASASAAELAEHFARVRGRSVACVTDGANGAWWARGEAPEAVSHQPAFPVESVVDSTGCGDVFHGVYCAGLVRGASVSLRMRWASAAAALKTQVRGAQAGAPREAEVAEFLKDHKVHEEIY